MCLLEMKRPGIYVPWNGDDNSTWNSPCDGAQNAQHMISSFTPHPPPSGSIPESFYDSTSATTIWEDTGKSHGVSENLADVSACDGHYHPSVTRPRDP
uniref:Uncharacterized protein n=1 Tax=Physcomitrium patens TaxID=3218 RepID=A0A2K1L381_PHYPA|nr:hypothetical protein PHYPA_003280 [Physcomitrium patens]